ncbi:MAG: hypothetical protein EOP06_10610 [Proteobacteria bacterium]|nr:MAG: hypothetical protein EOP06_10610 [Pseudomonadota bacterium]
MKTISTVLLALLLLPGIGLAQTNQGTLPMLPETQAKLIGFEGQTDLARFYAESRSRNTLPLLHIAQNPQEAWVLAKIVSSELGVSSVSFVMNDAGKVVDETKASASPSTVYDVQTQFATNLSSVSLPDNEINQATVPQRPYGLTAEDLCHPFHYGGYVLMQVHPEASGGERYTNVFIISPEDMPLISAAVQYFRANQDLLNKLQRTGDGKMDAQQRKKVEERVKKLLPSKNVFLSLAALELLDKNSVLTEDDIKTAMNRSSNTQFATIAFRLLRMPSLYGSTKRALVLSEATARVQRASDWTGIWAPVSAAYEFPNRSGLNLVVLPEEGASLSSAIAAQSQSVALTPSRTVSKIAENQMSINHLFVKQLVSVLQMQQEKAAQAKNP